MNSSTPDFSTMNLGLRLGGWNVRTLVIRGHFNLIVFKHELFYPGLFNHESGVEIFGVEMSGNPQNGQRHQLLSSWFVVMRKNVRVTGSSAMFVVKIFGNGITWHVTWQPIKTEKKKWAWLMWMWTWAWTWAWILTQKFIIDYYARLKYYMYVVSSPVFLVTGALYEASLESATVSN